MWSNVQILYFIRWVNEQKLRNRKFNIENSQKTIEDALTPKSLQELPEMFSQELVKIINAMPQWIQTAMKQLPQQLTDKKLEALQQFSGAMKRQLSFMQLMKVINIKWMVSLNISNVFLYRQSCKLALTQQDNVLLMCAEIERIDTYEIWSQMVSLCSDGQLDIIYNSFCELVSAIQRGVNIEHLTDWVKTVVDKCVVNVSVNQWEVTL